MCLFRFSYLDIWHRHTDAGPNAPMPAVHAALDTLLTRWGAPAEKLVLAIPWYGYTYRCQDPVPSPLPSNPIFDPNGLPSRPNCSAGVAPAGTFAPCCSPWAPTSSSSARDFEAQLAARTTQNNCSAKVADVRTGSTVFECHRGGERFQSWFDDEVATAAKASLANKLRLGGLAMWTAGNVPSGAVGARYWQAIAMYSHADAGGR
jgi:spore germination protein YaaH